MVNLNVKISKHAKDLIQKYAAGLFKNSSLAFYGVKAARIKEIISVDLPAVAVTGSAADFVFLLEDNTYLHFEFQTTYNASDLLRFAGYDIRLYDNVVQAEVDVGDGFFCVSVPVIVHRKALVRLAFRYALVYFPHLCQRFDVRHGEVFSVYRP